MKDDKKSKFEYLEVRYFEPTESVNKEACFILNSKLADLKEIYERALFRLEQTNHGL